MTEKEAATFQEDQFVKELFAELETRIQHYEEEPEAAIPKMKVTDGFASLIITVLIAIGFVLAIK
jgi:hypothetical protein